MTESRQELVNWINELLDLNILKVEQCGTGAVYCQIFDSIYLDVPMSKVKFNVKSEYQYLNNFKVLQAEFNKHHIDRSIPVERLIKCRFQDNLEFLQWTRRYWDSNYPGNRYDASARRKGTGSSSEHDPAGPLIGASSAANINSPAHRPAKRVTSRGTGTAAAQQAKQNNVGSSSTAPSSVLRSATNSTRLRMSKPLSAPDQSSAALLAARNQIAELSEENLELINTVELIESERDFYFQKLRDIELLVESSADALGDVEGEPVDPESAANALNVLNLENGTVVQRKLINEIQAILYYVEEGFEIPDVENPAPGTEAEPF